MSRKMLVIEDSHVAFLTLTFIIQLYNPVKFDVIHTTKLMEGLELARLERPDIITLDLTLADSSCGNTINHIRALSNFAPVIVVSSDDLRTLCMDAGASAFILKKDLTLENKDKIETTIWRVVDRLGNAPSSRD